MKKLILATALLAIAAVPVSAGAAQCRNSANGKFAKCGTPGAIPASQYVAKGKSKAKAGAMMAAAPAAAAAKPAKPGMMAAMKAKMAAKPAAKPTAAAGKMTAKRCKDAKGHFMKCAA